MSGERCICEPSEVLIFPCSGASNLGQVANEAALRLREAGRGTMYCTAGIGGHVQGLVDGARQARVLVGIDGCSVRCVRRCLEAVGLSPTVYLVVSDELEMKKGYVRPEEGQVEAFMRTMMARMDSIVADDR
jgi:uncharacterized metal-binding protein